MLHIFIWGAGHYARQVMEEIDSATTNIKGFIDSDVKKQGQKLLPSTVQIFSPQYILESDFDYIVISAKNYEPIEYECIKLGVRKERIIAYWRKEQKSNIFKARSQRVEELMGEKMRLLYRLDSAPYEWGIAQIPTIETGTELLKKIIKDKSSLCRFGDGEFEMIRERERPWFQKPDSMLAKRLKEILSSREENVIVAVAQNFRGLDQYKDEAAEGIRKYMYGDTRKYILELLDAHRIYYDAYVTRPYIIYKERNNANEIFPLFKKTLCGRDVVIVEGEYSRIGLGNDLMDNTGSLRRILCPSQNAWDKYETILGYIVQNVSRESLICISLGPCATVLAYDLAKEGYQALDIGQIDNEYEWYLRDAKQRMTIPGKMVAECREGQTFEIPDDEKYRHQIMIKII